jgi:hypothetical protein
LSGDIGGSLEGSDKSLLRGREEEGLEGEVYNMGDTADTASFRVEFDLMKD